VVAGGHDHPVAASAIRRLSRGARIDSMGTANLVYGETDGPIAPRLDPFMAFSVPVSNHPGLACLGVMELSAALEPARADPTHFAAELAREHLADQLPQDADELDTGPWTTPRGIRRRLESATLHTRRMFEAMDEAGVVPGPIYATGGYARSLAFLELRASVFGVPLFAIDEPELAAIGGALLAAEGIGAPVPELDRSRRILTIEPVPAWVRAYDDLYPAIRRRLDAAYQNNEAGGSFPG
jgi:xylulokinase